MTQTFTDFLDIYLDDQIAGFPCNSSPRFNTTITTAWSGDENRNRNWLHPLRKFNLPDAIREHVQYEAIQDHWLIMGGPEKSFPFVDPLDFASRPLEVPNEAPDIAGDDQSFGVGDGTTRAFQIQKTYVRQSGTYTRPIYLPVISSLIVELNGFAPEDVPALQGGPYAIVSVTRPGGVILFDHAPQAGMTVTGGFLYDVAVRFEADDSFDGIVQSYQVSGFAALTFVELRPC